MNRPPAFLFYPKDWDDFKVQRMSYEIQGIYLKILCLMWKDSKDQCSILNNDKFISNALGLSLKKWRAAKKEIQYDGDPLLKETDEKFTSNRLKKEVKKLKDYRKTQSIKGKKSAFLRKTRDTTVEPRLNRSTNRGVNRKPTGTPTGGQPKSNISISSSISNKDKDKYIVEYDIFWKSWPSDRRQKEPYTRMKFMALCKKGELDKFKIACQNYAAELDYQKNNNNFDQTAMLTSTWMNNWKEWVDRKGQKGARL